MRAHCFSRFSLLLIGAFCVCIGLCRPVQAQSLAEDTLPIEIKLLYHKMTNSHPDFTAIIYSNPEFAKNRNSPSHSAMLQQQHLLLSQIYNNTGINKTLYLHRAMQSIGINRPERMIGFEPITPDTPFLYRISDKEIYAVFFRNGNTLERITPPYDFDDFVSMEREHASDQGKLSVQLAFKPVVADTNPFVLPNGESVKVILADITEIKIDSKEDRKLFVHKRLNDDGGLPLPIPQATKEPVADFAPLPPAQ